MAGQLKASSARNEPAYRSRGRPRPRRKQSESVGGSASWHRSGGRAMSVIMPGGLGVGNRFSPQAKDFFTQGEVIAGDGTEFGPVLDTARVRGSGWVRVRSGAMPIAFAISVLLALAPHERSSVPG